MKMNALLLHGMGRTPASMLLLAHRLHGFGINTNLFGYSTFACFDAVVNRLVKRVQALPSARPFILVGHSLGSVLIRAALPLLGPLAPAGCFFVASPTCACRAARFFGGSRVFRLVTRDMGGALASTEFMSALPVPACPMRIYAGTGGFRGRFSPFGREANDGILAVSETALGSEPVVTVPSVHTFIMNSKVIARDIAETALSLRSDEGRQRR